MSESSEHPQQIGIYEILGELGRGSMGSVYKAVEPSHNEIVAIKWLPKRFSDDPEKVERFQREVKAVEMLDHPNVVRMLDKGEDEEGCFYFVMEYVPGTSLDALMRRRRLTLQEALGVLKEVGAGLEAAHRKNIIHRDLNPRNILVSEDLTTVKLADFGISKVESLSRELGTLTTGQVSMGSLHYMAPEQGSAMADVDHRADIYSLGVLLYEMLTGRVPVGRFSLPSQLNTEVPPQFDPVLLKCLETDPTERYPSVHHLLQAVSRLEDRLRIGLVRELRGFSSGTSKIFVRSTRTFTRGRRRWVLAAVGVVAVVGGIVAALLLNRPPAPAPAVDDDVVAALPEPDEAVDDPSAPQSDESAAGASADEEVDAAAAEPPDPPAPAPTPAVTPTPPQPRSPPPAAAPSARAASAPAASEDFRVAMEKYEAELYGPALKDLRQFVEESSGHSSAPSAYLTIARIHEAEERSEAAMAAYLEVETRFPEAAEAAEALYRMAAMTGAQRGRDNRLEARRLFENLVERHGGSEWAPRALLRKAEIEDDVKLEAVDPELGRRVRVAVTTLRRLVGDYPESAEMERALVELTELYDNEKLYEEAADAYRQLAERYPDRHAGEGWWEAGQIYDRRLDDNERAVEAYQRVPPESERYRDAQKRLARITD